MAAELCGRCYSPYMTRKKRLRDKGKIPFKRTPIMIPSHQVLLPGHDTTLWSHLRFDPLKKCRFCMAQSLLNDYFHRLRTNSSALLHSGPGRWRRRQQSLMCKHKSMSSNPSWPCKNPRLKPRCWEVRGKRITLASWPPAWFQEVRWRMIKLDDRHSTVTSKCKDRHINSQTHGHIPQTHISHTCTTLTHKDR